MQKRRPKGNRRSQQPGDDMTTEQTDNMTDHAVMTVFMLVKTMPEWLGLAAAERARQLGLHVAPLLRRYSDQVRPRFFDIEFYNARVTDLWLWEVHDQKAWQSLVEDLRDTPFWDRYFQIIDILPGIENAYAGAQQRLPASG
jgi:hypothetical protein